MVRNSGYDTIIDRKKKDFNYFNIMKNFIMGFAIDEIFMEEHDSYLDGFMDIKGLNVHEKEYNNFLDICRNYMNIKSITDMSLISGKIKKFIHQD